MTAVHPAAVPAGRKSPRAGTVFLAVLSRDVFVTTRRELGVFLSQVTVQPLFMLFVFVKVLSGMSYVGKDFGDVLLPGVISMAGFVAAFQTVALPLIMEFGYTKEIEDRLLAPIPLRLLAVEKMVMATLRAVFAALLMYPLSALVAGSAPWRAAGLPWMLLCLVLGGWAGGAIGLILGTALPPQRVNIMFALILTPLMFTGGIQYPWPSLDGMRWFQVVTALNPMTYQSEGLRAALVPSVDHIPLSVSLGVLLVMDIALTALGIRGFRRRALG
ncbi:ABC transporter permease [Streptomyces sp. BHT-5-2]|uniref:ABC transporter permease n=1 Tax=Streptomyces sp. BHT-5-2 TaxID=2866715 RepID=UPI001C8EF250|nr:ABC transporter permease [Streptomyces sp. BHT-5-2]QZL06411.1 ABC transporter permease [Streptomyces sp. BHT-5-2]